MSTAHLNNFVMLLCIALVGCRIGTPSNERFEVYVKNDDGTPINGVSVMNWGSEIPHKVITDNNGLAIMEKHQNGAGIDNLRIGINQSIFRVTVPNIAGIGKVIFMPNSKMWEEYNTSGQIVRTDRAVLDFNASGSDNQKK
jgi:hypothetical protein